MNFLKEGIGGEPLHKTKETRKVYNPQAGGIISAPQKKFSTAPVDLARKLAEKNARQNIYNKNAEYRLKNWR